jgi:tRNA (guanine-N7-)-methyltransferase
VPSERPTWHARAGRLSSRKRWALEGLAERYSPWTGADGGVLEPSGLRAAAGGVAVEIGAGTGEAAVALAAARPDWIIFAAEVHRSSRATMLLAAHDAGVANLRVAAVDGRQLLRLVAAERRVDLVRVLFPDPWPKRRHRSRRLVNGAFADVLAGCLAPGGVVELATDDAAYAAAAAAALRADGWSSWRRAGGAGR